MNKLMTAVTAVALVAGASATMSAQRNGSGGAGQQNPMQNPQPYPGRGNIGLPSIDGRDATMDTLGPRLEEQQTKTRNNERQKKLVADTEKLLALANDLKQQVDKTEKDVVSVDAVKKAEEIEKLAKSVKDRMKG